MTIGNHITKFAGRPVKDFKPGGKPARGKVVYRLALGDEDKNSFIGNARALLTPIDWPEPFGLVMIEALACGTPVAAYPVMGPVDVLTEQTGAMSEQLDQAVAQALALSPAACVAHAGSFTWRRSAEQFLDSLHWLDRAALPRAA